jgi:hypothetical protein
MLLAVPCREHADKHKEGTTVSFIQWTQLIDDKTALLLLQQARTPAHAVS